jgi:5'-3' exonuclease
MRDEKLIRYRNIIIDGSFFLHLYTLTLNPLYNSEFEDISIAYYFIKRLYSIIDIYKPLENVYVILDVGRDLKKKAKYDLYKANRKIAKKSDFSKNTLDEDRYNRLKFNRRLIYEILKTTPISTFAIPYVEGDTIMAFINEKHLKPNYLKSEEKRNYDLENNIRNTIIITADKDFIQLVDENTDIILMNSITQNVLYTKEDTLKLFEIVFFKGDAKLRNLFVELSDNGKKVISLKNIVFYRAFTGDVSDNIPGLKGFGDKLVSTMLIFQQYKKHLLFNTVSEFIEFWKDNLDEYKRFVKIYLKGRRVNIKRVEQFLNSEEEQKIFKTFFELMDFSHSIENIPIYVKQELTSRLEDVEEYKYHRNSFLNLISQYEFNSENEYIMWDFFNKMLELNNKIEPFTTLEKNGFTLFKYDTSKTIETYKHLKDLQNFIRNKLFNINSKYRDILT